MNVYEYKNRRNILLAILFVAIFIFAVASCSADKPVGDWEEVKLSFKVGDISDSGEILVDDTCLYTSDLIECTGFKLSKDISANVKYEIHYYDKDGKHLADTDDFTNPVVNDTVEYSVPPISMPEGAAAIRIVVCTLSGEDMDLIWNKLKYNDVVTLHITNIEAAAE